MVGAPMTQDPLLEVRRRLDVIDAELLRLIGERSALAGEVAEAKRLIGAPPGVHAAREAALLRARIANRGPSTARLVTRVWRELMGENLWLQGGFALTVWGGKDPSRTLELARERFGDAPPIRRANTAEEAIVAARPPGAVAVLPLEPNSAWWGRLLAEPKVRIFSALPELSTDGATGAFAIGDVSVEPTGGDETYWVTDAPQSVTAIEQALGQDGLAARPLAEAGGLKLFGLLGYVQAHDERLARAPGRLTGVIGAAPTAFDL
jgi:chorismate mutase